MSNSSFTIFLLIIEMIFGILACLTAIFLFTILFCRYISQGSVTLKIYIVMEIIISIFNLLYFIYTTSFWRGMETIYSAKSLFWFGFCAVMFSLTRPLFVCSLGMERIFCILFPCKYQKSLIYSFVFAAFFTGIIFVLYFFISGTVVIPIDNYTSCLAIGCLQSIVYLNVCIYFRDALSIINIIVGAILLFEIKKNIHSIEGKKKSNTLVLSTITLTFLLDFCPHILSLIVTAVIFLVV